ncbi:putative uncharacterized protein encoded by MIR1915-HG [Zalophus californianus]|uniref:Uncharacterized protein n=1 Tax=Zalophus californianus TaxID=9704 RepID=A0A6P9FDG1_ZALCA|nr:putative uncharacterized protein encoded by MIR1915-HG [Zalophus californianus]
MEACERELGSWGSPGRKGSFSTRRKGRWASPPPPGTEARELARLAARRGAGGTTGQQRLLQVPGASAVAAPRGLLRWNQPRSPPALLALPQQWFHPLPISLPKRALTVQNGRSVLAPAAISLTPWPHFLQHLIRGSPGIDLDDHN